MADIKEVPGAGTYQNIVELMDEMVLAMARSATEPNATSDIMDRITEMPLSVSVRSGWQRPGVNDQSPEEYELLMGTGGPAVRIYGRLDEHGRPRSAELQGQNWFTPWERTTVDQDEEVLLQFAEYFYYD
tara:strand:- start:29 stop:418 length:390 start_codon:yes stop_codon:yes gene_type:complete